eukprot:6748676-Prymnesium_polylepis.1
MMRLGGARPKALNLEVKMKTSEIAACLLCGPTASARSARRRDGLDFGRAGSAGFGARGGPNAPA